MTILQKQFALLEIVLVLFFCDSLCDIADTELRFLTLILIQCTEKSHSSPAWLLMLKINQEKKRERERKDDLTKAGKLEKGALSFSTKATCKLENLEGKKNMEEGKKERRKEGRKIRDEISKIM